MTAALIVLSLLLLISLVLLSGRGAWLIAGYNTMSREEKAKYDEKALCRRVGALLLAITACGGLMVLAAELRWTWLSWLSAGLTAAVLIGGMIWVNRSPGKK